MPGAAPQGGQVAPEVLETPLQRESTTDGGGAFLLLTQEGETVTVRYLFSAPAEARVELAGREAEVQIEPGSGSLEISTEGLPAGNARPDDHGPARADLPRAIEIGG